ncbi:uncharacterized protein LOC128670052 [Plodia interpunctella]|uniref:uncharacterized protein LOC128670052 n=1 Tax=Plodia interpunctella TaxID=58824 RepID=UPI0023688C92|nr:uncharacterized protein LOC128670052 [Plodia interpunctella]
MHFYITIYFKFKLCPTRLENMSSVITVYYFSVILLVSAFGSRKVGLKKPDTIEPDIPQKSDLDTYLTSLENMIKFYVKNPNEIDVNSVFGFFLMNVNLNSVLIKKAQALPLTLANRFKNLVEKNKRIVAYFRMMASQSQLQSPRHKKLKKLSTLFSNESYWISKIKQADSTQIQDPPQMGSKDILVHFSSWPEYKEEIDNLGRLMPPFALTEKCLVIVAENPVNYGTSSAPNCIMPHECINGISAGNDIGLGLVNRLLILLQARFGRRCAVLNETEDATLVDKLCNTCFKEGLFISMNKYDPLILMMEQITLCSLNGNVEFLRRFWIAHILALQTKYGCFATNIRYAMSNKPVSALPPSNWNMDRENKPNPVTHCLGPASAGAAAIISAAIKYILEIYF